MGNLKQEGMTDQFKGKVRSTWGDVTDDDVQSSKGNMEQLIGKIKEKTGEAEDDIRKQLDKLRDDN